MVIITIENSFSERRLSRRFDTKVAQLISLGVISLKFCRKKYCAPMIHGQFQN